MQFHGIFLIFPIFTKYCIEIFKKKFIKLILMISRGFFLCNVLFFRLYSANDPVWLTKGAPYHLLHVLAKLLEKFADAPSTVLTNER